MTNQAANDLASEFAAKKIRQRVNDPKVADLLIPKNHGFGTRRLPLNLSWALPFWSQLFHKTKGKASSKQYSESLVTITKRRNFTFVLQPKNDISVEIQTRYYIFGFDVINTWHCIIYIDIISNYILYLSSIFIS